MISDVAHLLTFLIVIVLIVILAVKLLSAVSVKRKAGTLLMNERQSPDRAAREAELVGRLDKIRKSRDRSLAESANDAVNQDPKRAAKTVSAMMKDKG